MPNEPEDGSEVSVDVFAVLDAENQDGAGFIVDVVKGSVFADADAVDGVFSLNLDATAGPWVLAEGLDMRLRAGPGVAW